MTEEVGNRCKALTVARWAMFFPAVLGLLCYGGTISSSVQKLEIMALALPLFYVICKWVSGTRWRHDGFSVIIFVLLLIWGWLSALLPTSVYEQELRIFLPLDINPYFPWGSVDGARSMASMTRITGMVFCFIVLADMAGCHIWRKRILYMIIALGGAAAVFGIAQKGGGDLLNYWGMPHLPENVFGFFWYHGNAGAFLNLCWPFIGVWLLKNRMKLRRDTALGQLKFAGVVLMFLGSVAAIGINIARAAHAVFIFQITITAALAAWFAVVQKENSKLLFKLAIMAVISGAITVGVVLAALWTGADRWIQFFEGGAFVDNPRWKAMGVMIQWLPDVILKGYGPGTFAALFVVKGTGDVDAPYGYWEYAHSDHLQTILEWGWIGYAMWMLIAGRVMSNNLVVLLESRRGGNWRTFSERAAVLVALSGVMLHAAVDFPLQIFAIQMMAVAIGALGITKSSG